MLFSQIKKLFSVLRSPWLLKQRPHSRNLVVHFGLLTSTGRRRGLIVPFVKASKTTSASMSDAVATEKTSEEPSSQKSTFPNGFEALILNVCDETSTAELKLKVGAFEMHLKRDIGNPVAPVSVAPTIASSTTAPPIPSKPMVESAPAAQPATPQKSAPVSKSPFANVASSKASKLAALEASVAKSYVLVSSPAEDIIKGGLTIGYLDQFGNELPIRSDVAGEVLKLLVKDGEAVGYGDPLVAVLPSFHGIN